MKKNKIIENVRIEKVGYHGIGLSSLEDGKKIIIKWWVLPESIVDCKVIKSKKDYVECQLLRVKKLPKSFELCQDLCPHYFFESWNQDWLNPSFWCWWCKWQILNYDDQIEIKRQIVIDSFRHIKDLITDFNLDEIQIVSNDAKYWYRNKIEFSCWKYLVLDKDESSSQEKKYKIAQHWNLGFHKQWEFSKVINIENCKLVDEKINKLLIYIKKIMFESGLPVYDQKIHQWFFRHLVFRHWINTDQVLVNLSVSDNFFNRANWWQSDYNKWLWLKSKIQKDEYINNNVNTFVVTYNNSLADIVKWPDIKQEILFWDWYIFEKLNLLDYQVNFRVSPFSFFQTNTLWAQKLFNNAIEMFWDNWWYLLDLYCGTWTIWLSFLKSWIFDKLIWIEVVSEAVEDARYNAKINWVDDRAEFYCWKAEEVLFDEEVKAKVYEINWIVVDPPREWLHKKVVNFLGDLKKIKDFKLLYISCNPVTMARDVELFLEHWFRLKMLKAVDMFPNTNHVESIWLLY